MATHTLIVSSTIKQVYPNFNFEQREESFNNRTRTIGGQENNFKIIGGNRSYVLPLDFVSSEDVAFYNSAWVNQDNVYYVQDLSTNPKFEKCYISNFSEPFPQTTQGQNTFFSGTIRLKTIRSMVTSNAINPVLANQRISQASSVGVFITDDALYGITDETYNPVI